MAETQALCLNDNCYNTIHQLTKTLEFLSRADRYVDDAKKAGDSDAQNIWQTIKSDRQKHANMLRELAIKEMKNQQF